MPRTRKRRSVSGIFEAEDGRRILIGWAGVPDTEKEHRNLSVENGWQHCLTLPCELTKQDGKILRMPVRELHNLPWEGREAEGGIYCWKDELPDNPDQRQPG